MREKVAHKIIYKNQKSVKTWKRTWPSPFSSFSRYFKPTKHDHFAERPTMKSW